MAKPKPIPACGAGCEHEGGHSNEADDTTGMVRSMHCIPCLSEKPQGVKLAEYARLGIGITAEGKLRVWCYRHKHVLTDLALA
jgi:hypothetical protein